MSDSGGIETMRVGGMKINLSPRRTSGPSWTLSCLERVPCLTSSASTSSHSHYRSSSCTRARGDKARRTPPGSCPWLGRDCGPSTSHPPRCYRLRAKSLSNQQTTLPGRQGRQIVEFSTVSEVVGGVGLSPSNLPDSAPPKTG